MKTQVIEIDEIFWSINNAFTAIRNKLVAAKGLQDHPDFNKYRVAEDMLENLLDSDLLSAKTKAIIHYHMALQNLYLYTVDEEEPT